MSYVFGVIKAVWHSTFQGRWCGSFDGCCWRGGCTILSMIVHELVVVATPHWIMPVLQLVACPRLLSMAECPSLLHFLAMVTIHVCQFLTMLCCPQPFKRKNAVICCGRCSCCQTETYSCSQCKAKVCHHLSGRLWAQMQGFNSCNKA